MEPSKSFKLGRYKTNARRRKIAWSLTNSQARSIAEKPCYFCGHTPSNGIDRYDNDKGYTVGNSVPCCSVCNRAKSIMHGDDYIRHCQRVVVHQKLKSLKEKS